MNTTNLDGRPVPERRTLVAREKAVRVAAAEKGVFKTIELARLACVPYGRLVQVLAGTRCGPRFAARVASACGRPVESLFAPAVRS